MRSARRTESPSPPTLPSDRPELQSSPLRMSFVVRYNMGTGSASMFIYSRGLELPKLMADPLVIKIAARHGKSPAQTLIRYLYDRNMVVIPKSTNADRIKQNFDVCFIIDIHGLVRCR